MDFILLARHQLFAGNGLKLLAAHEHELRLRALQPAVFIGNTHALQLAAQLSLFIHMQILKP